MDFRKACLTLLSLTVLLAGVCPYSQAVAARAVGPKLQFVESYGDLRSRDSVTQQGKLQIDAMMSLSGVSLKTINAQTPYFIGLGGMTMAGTLADDPKYRPGKKAVRIRDRGRELRMGWTRRRLQITLTVNTERGEPGAFAEVYMPSPDGPIAGQSRSFTSFGDRASQLDITYKGEKSTRNGIRKIRLSGGGDTDCGCG